MHPPSTPSPNNENSANFTNATKATNAEPLTTDNSFAALWGYRDFIRFWFARLLGTTGNQMLMVALGWQMYELTHSAWDLGLVGLFQFVPALVLFLPAGHVVDICVRSRVFAWCMAVQWLVAVVLLLGTLGIGADTPWITPELIWTLSIFLGGVHSFQSATQQAISPALVPPAILSRAVAFTSGGNQLAVIGGPAVGGFLYALQPCAVYWTCAGLFMLGTAVGLSLNDPPASSSKEPVTIRTITAGIRFMLNNSIVLGASTLDLFAVLLGGATALLPIYAKDILNAGPVELGILRASPALGALIMTSVLAWWPLQRRVGYKLFASVVFFGLMTVLFGVSHSLWLSVLALILCGVADSISVVIRMTLIQLETPNAMRGRVGAVNGIFIGASNQLGEFESGASAALLGPVGSVVLGGLGCIFIAVLWSFKFKALRQRDLLNQ